MTDYEYLLDDDFSSCNNDNYKNEIKYEDNGYNSVNRIINKKKVTIQFYTSKGKDTNIRNAETGDFFIRNQKTKFRETYYKVGSSDEDLFYKVMLSTGECKSKNGSNTMFFYSPHHYMDHFNCELDEIHITNWKLKYNERIKVIESMNNNNNNNISNNNISNNNIKKYINKYIDN